MNLYNTLWETIENGEKGLNEGLPFNVKRLSKYVLISKKRYYLIFAQPGVGKSAFLYDQFIYQPLKLLLNKKTIKNISWLFWNLEIPNSDFIGILTCKWLFDHYKILIDIDYLYAVRKKKQLNMKIKKILESLEYRTFISELDKRMSIYNIGSSRTIRDIIDKYFNDRGEVKTNKRGNKYYIPENKDEMVFVLLDHIGLLKQAKNEPNEWKTLVNASSIIKDARNLYYLTAGVVQQVNPEKQTYRDKDRVMADHEHLRGGKETMQDCDTAIVTGSPYKFRKETYYDYKVLPTENNDNEGLSDRLRILEIRKNRGVLPNFIPTLYLGEVGIYSDIENPNNVDYSSINKITKLQH